MYPVAASVPNAGGNTRGEQRRRREADLLGQLAPRRYFWHLTAPNTATRQLPPDPIRGAHQQQCWTDIDRPHGALMPRALQLPPHAGERETKAESCSPGKVEK
jgi:hypothetical protein